MFGVYHYKINVREFEKLWNLLANLMFDSGQTVCGSAAVASPAPKYEVQNIFIAGKQVESYIYTICIQGTPTPYQQNTFQLNRIELNYIELN